MQEENSGFYVVEDKKGDIVGQGWAVLYEEKGKQVLAIDSWENIQDRLSDNESSKLLAHFGYLCKENQKIDEIRLGVGSGFGARMADNKGLVKIEQPTYPNSEKYNDGQKLYRDGATAVAIDSKKLESAKTMNSESHTRQNDKLTLSINNVEQDYVASQISAITSAADLCKLICGLPKEYGNKVIDTVADQLGGDDGLIRDAYQLEALLKVVSSEQQTFVLKKVADQLGGDDGLIGDAYQLGALLKVIGSEQQTFVLKKVAEQLVGLIDHNYSNQLEDLLKAVGPAQQTLILEKVAEQLVGENGWIGSSRSLMSLLEAVGSEQQTFILNLVADSLLNTALLEGMPDELKSDVMRRRAEMTEHSSPPGTSGKTNTHYEEIFMPTEKGSLHCGPGV